MLAEVTDLLIPIDAASAEPLNRQVYQGIREAILSGHLAAGVRIPSSRSLAAHLSVSRSTVLVAFEQLAAEGFIDGAVGSGSYVARHIPEHLLRGHRAQSPPPAIESPPAISERGRQLAQIPPQGPRPVPYPRAFWIGVPPVDVFPLSLWRRLVARRQRCLSPAALHHGSAAGYGPLRDAIAAHLAATRGMRCTGDQVLVFSSAQEALELACRSLLDPGDTAWLENPAWAGARGALIAAGARIVPVAVDQAGIDVAQGESAAPEARLAYVTPSHQYPLGVTQSLERRMALLGWASRAGAWILEDDYDSEFRYSGRPLTALHALDASARVLYVGTFNKTIFPALRLAYMVLPPSLVDPILAARRIGGQHPPAFTQHVVADFLGEGHYARHLRRSRAVCLQRRDALVAAAGRVAPGVFTLGQADAGLHTIAWLSPGVDDALVSQEAGRRGVEAAPLSRCYVGAAPRPGLVLGYAGVETASIGPALDRLAAAVRACADRSD